MSSRTAAGQGEGWDGATPASSGTTRWGLLLGLALVVGTGTLMAVRNSLWFDEACTIFTTGGGPVEAFRRALRFEQQPPVYFLLAWAWRALHPSLEFLRLLSTGCAALTVLLLARMSADLRIGGRWWNLALLGALMPALLWTASEARVYALALLLVTASTWWFVRLLDPAREPALSDLLGYVAAAYLGLLTFYYTGFVLVGHALAGLTSPRRRQLLLADAMLGLLLLPWLPVIFAQLRAGQHYLPDLAWASESTGLWWLVRAVPWAGSAIAEAVFRSAPLLHGWRGFVAVTLALGVTTAARGLPGARRPSPLEWRLVLAALTPVAILLGLRLTNLSLVEDRHWVVALPGLLLLLGLAIEGTAPGWPRRAALGVVLLTLAAATTSYLRNFRGQGDWRSVAGYLGRHVVAGEPLLFYATDGALPLAYYFPPSNPVYQVPEPDKSRSHLVIRLTAADVERTRAALAEARASGGLWVLEKAGLPADSALVMLRRYAGDSLEVTDSTTFVRTRVRRVAVRPRPQASR